MAGLDLDERRLLDALLEGERAAVSEATSSRWPEQRRRGAGNPDQPLLVVPDPHLRQRRDQESRVGVAGRFDDHARRRLLRQVTGVHDEDRVGDLVQDRDVVRDHDHALDEAALPELHEHLGNRLLSRRTNYLFALGDLAGKLASFEIPIYLADSVLWPQRNGQMALKPRGESVEVSTSLQPFFVPKIWVEDKGFLMARAAPLVERMVKQKYSVAEALRRFKEEGLVFPPHEQVVEDFYNQIVELERQGKNGIWARLLKNIFAPMVAGAI